MQLRAWALAMLFTSGACSYRTPTVRVPSELPSTTTASELTVSVTERGQAHELSDYDLNRAMSWTNEILRDEGTHPPGRTAVRIDIEDRVAWMQYCGPMCLVPVLAGVNAGRVTLSVELDVDAGGRRYRGRGHATRSGSLYANAFKRALAVALDRALADAVR